MRLLFDRADRWIASGAWWTSALLTPLIIGLGLALDVREPELWPFLAALAFSVSLVPLGGLVRHLRRGTRRGRRLRARFGCFAMSERGELLIDEELEAVAGRSPEAYAAMCKRVDLPATVTLPKLAPWRERVGRWLLFTMPILTGVVCSALSVPVDRLLPIVVYASVTVASLVPILTRRSTELVVGRDGVRLGKRFVPYAEFSHFGIYGRSCLTVFRRDGDNVNSYLDVPVAIAPTLTSLARRLVEEEENVDASLFARRTGEGDPEWRQRVKTIFDQADFRAAPITLEVAKAVLRSPLASRQVRVGAALALKEHEPAFVEELADEFADLDWKKELERG